MMEVPHRLSWHATSVEVLTMVEYYDQSTAMKGVEMASNILHIYYTAGTTIPLKFSLCASLLMHTMWNCSW